MSFLVVDQLAVQIPWVPVDQHTAKIKHQSFYHALSPSRDIAIFCQLGFEVFD